MKIKNILESTNGRLIIGDKEKEIEYDRICKDTRIIKPGDIYIGIKGENFDGNELWEGAFENGAQSVILQDVEFTKEELEKYKEKDIIIVEDTIKALADIAKYIRNLYNIPVVGITGSVGKTSTKDIIANVISQKYDTLKTEGNNNNFIGLPFTLFRLKDQEAAVIEMGMNHLEEISYLSNITKPTISVITNVGTSHIGNLGSRENILKAKLEILDGMDKKVLVINNDNDLLHKYYLENSKNNEIELHTYGIENNSEIMAENIVLNENSNEFTCKINGSDINIKVPVGGIHFVYNALSAIAVGSILGLDIEQIKQGIETFELTKKRMDITKLENGVVIINDSYNASFESMKASLKYLEKQNCKRKIAILGDMFELGEFSKELHTKVGKEAADAKIDILVCAGKDAKHIAESAKKEGMNEKNIYYFEDKEKIEQFIKDSWKEGDVLLFKASNGMKFFKIVDNLIK